MSVFRPSLPPSRKTETMIGSVPGVAACADAASQM
jgi:hypothetical protein